MRGSPSGWLRLLQTITGSINPPQKNSPSKKIFSFGNAETVSRASPSFCGNVGNPTTCDFFPLRYRGRFSKQVDIFSLLQEHFGVWLVGVWGFFFHNVGFFSHLSSSRVPRLLRAPASGAVIAGGTLESQLPLGAAPAQPGTGPVSRHRARRPFPSHRNASKPRKTMRPISKPGEGAVGKVTQTARTSPPRLYCRPPLERHTHTQPAQGNRVGKAAPSRSSTSWPAWFLQAPAVYSDPEVARVGTGEVSQASPRMASLSREAEPAERPLLVRVLLRANQPFVAEVGHFATVPRAGMPSSGWPGPAPQGAKGRAAGKRSGTQQVGERKPERIAQESLKHPHPSQV